MSFDRRRHSRAHFHDWPGKRLAVRFASDSWVAVGDTGAGGEPQQLAGGRAHVTLALVSGRTVRQEAAWAEEIHALLAPQSTEALRRMLAMVKRWHSVSAAATGFVVHAIVTELLDAARKAAFLGHDMLRADFVLAVEQRAAPPVINKGGAAAEEGGSGGGCRRRRREEDEVAEAAGGCRLVEYMRLGCSHTLPVWWVADWINRRGICPICRPEAVDGNEKRVGAM
ncbi:hypothetical protein AXF42_Ash005235 [Apostasia shenzhenica]|uniref:Uncharacterized protein n=1 Tax=Apostasia shenzhenica TaxID=1088818 RepID=A0A2I0B6D0_9ASPA|nr:hypothetical protein AXF42_Ash005235 [Apostasia shenzhenica]